MGTTNKIMEQTGSYCDTNKKNYTVYVNGLLEFMSLQWEIINTASYLVKGHYSLEDEADIASVFQKLDTVKSTVLDFLPSPVYAGRIPVYTDASNFVRKPRKAGEVLEFDGTKRIVPELSSYMDGILEGDDDAIAQLLAYPEHEDMVSIDDQIRAVNGELEQTDNAEFDKKIDLLRKLKSLTETKDSNKHFDSELLLKYYEQVCDMVELEETVKGKKAGKRLTLGEYRKTISR